jgi:hypothetical protein
MEQVSERPFTHTAIAPRVSQDYPTQRWFYGNVGSVNLYAADGTSYADVYRDGWKNVAEVRLSRYGSGAQFMAHVEFTASALRELAQRLLDAACDIEANPGSMTTP